MKALYRGFLFDAMINRSLSSGEELMTAGKPVMTLLSRFVTLSFGIVDDA